MTRCLLSDGNELNIETWGTGQPLVVLHGFTGSAASWQGPLPSLAGQFKVIAIDLLGHGRSSAPADPARYEMAHCLADLLEVFDSLNLDRPALLGYSMGGRVALAFAIERPDRVGQLILESASPGLAAAEEQTTRIASDEVLAQRLERDGLEAFMNYWEALPLFASQASLPAEVRARVRAGRLRNNPVGLAGSLRGLGTGRQPSYWGRLGEVTVPSLIVAGALDAKFTGIATQMAARLHQAQLQIVPEAGHTVHLEQPAIFSRLVVEFLNAKRN